MRTLVEVTRQYARGTRVAKGVANWLRRQGQDAFPYGGPMAGSFVLIPAATERLRELPRRLPIQQAGRRVESRRKTREAHARRRSTNDRRILRAGRRATGVMQKYHTRADSVHERAFAAPLGFCPLLFCAAHHISRNAATCRRMPSLGVSSLNSGRSSERPPFFDNPLCNVRKRTKKGGEGGFVRLFAHILCLQY